MSSHQETHHRLDRESLRELVRDGKWEEIIKRLSGFTKPDHWIFFKIYRHMYLKAVYKKELSEALRIYQNNLQKFYEPSKHEHFKELEHLMDLADPRENKNFADYWDNRTARNRFAELHAPRGDEASDRSGIHNVISQPSQCLSLRLPDEEPVRVTGLLYTNSGAEILVLRADGVHHLWKWPKQKATASVLPNLHKSRHNPSMKNDIRDTDPRNSIASVALTKNDCYMLSTSGGAVSLFNKETFKNLATLLPPPPTPTCLAFDPDNSSIAAIGMEDSSIVILDFGVLKVSCKLIGHHGRVTGLAFSGSLKVLVTAAADREIIVWSKDKWEKETSKQLRIPGVAAPLGDTRLQFHRDQKQLLVIHKDHLAVFEAPRLECKMQWRPLEANDSITNATYSCDGHQIYVVTQEGGNIVILTSTSLRMLCRIHFTAYMDLCTSPPYPVMVAAHPSEPNQFALGLTDGRVYVIQPIESAGRWPESVFGPSTSETEHKEQVADLPSSMTTPVKHLKLKGKRKLDSTNTNPPKRRSSARSLRTKATREQEIRDANTSASVMLCISEYHKNDSVQTPVISRGSIPSVKTIEVEQSGEQNLSGKLKEKRQLESGQTMQVHQGCDPKLSRKSEEKRLPESSQTIEVEQNFEQNPSGNWKEKGLFKSSHKFEVEQDGESGEMSEVEQARETLKERDCLKQVR